MDGACNQETARSTRILLIAAVGLEREGLKLLLERCGYSVSEAASPENALAEPVGLPALILIDIAAQGEPRDWMPRLFALRRQYPLAALVLLGAPLARGWLSLCRELELDGYLSKESRTEVFRGQLELILGGVPIFPFDLVRKPVDEADNGRFPSSSAIGISPFEKEILRHLLGGFPNKAIAERLNVTESTVKMRMKAVFQKIHVANRTQAALWALKNGIDKAVENG